MKMKSLWVSAAWIYVLCLFQNGDATITAWTEPAINAKSGNGTYSFAEDIATGSAGVAKSFAVTGDGTSSFTLITTGTPFSVSTAGVLSLDTALDYETTKTYTIDVRAVDDTPSTGYASITVTVTNVNEPPVFAKTLYGVNIADGSTAGTTLTTVTATDPDEGDTIITYSISNSSNFTIGSSTGIITVATSNTLAASTTAAYALEVKAADNDGTPKTGTTTIAVIVKSCSSSAVLFAGSLLVVMMTSLLALLK